MVDAVGAVLIKVRGFRVVSKEGERKREHTESLIS